MKQICIIIIVIVFAILMTSCGSQYYSVCPACGDECKSLTPCPVCGVLVCEYCADPESYFDYGDMIKYVESKGYLVFYDWNEALAAMIENDIDWVAECVADNGYTVIKNGEKD